MSTNTIRRVLAVTFISAAMVATAACSTSSPWQPKATATTPAAGPILPSTSAQASVAPSSTPSGGAATSVTPNHFTQDASKDHPDPVKDVTRTKSQGCPETTATSGGTRN